MDTYAEWNVEVVKTIDRVGLVLLGEVGKVDWKFSVQLLLCEVFPRDSFDSVVEMTV